MGADELQAVVVVFDVPASFVHGPVVVPAHQHQVVEGGRPAVWANKTRNWTGPGPGSLGGRVGSPLRWHPPSRLGFSPAARASRSVSGTGGFSLVRGGSLVGQGTAKQCVQLNTVRLAVAVAGFARLMVGWLPC